MSGQTLPNIEYMQLHMAHPDTLWEARGIDGLVFVVTSFKYFKDF